MTPFRRKPVVSIQASQKQFVQNFASIQDLFFGTMARTFLDAF
jgi:hypothetical protein